MARQVRVLAFAELAVHDDIDAMAVRCWRQCKREEPRMIRRVLIGISRDARSALRRLMRAPLYTASAVAVLAIGLASTVAAHALFDGLANQPIRMNDASRVFSVGSDGQGWMSRLDFDDLRARQTAFVSLQASTTAPVAIANAEQSILTNCGLLTGGYFALAGTRPLQGRLLDPEDDRPGAPGVAVLSEEIWRSRFLSDPSMIGRSITIGGDPYVVVGVAPNTFRSDPSVIIGAYLALSHPPSAARAHLATYALNRGISSLRAVGRLVMGIAPEQASGEVAAIATALDTAVPLGPAPQSARKWALAPISAVTPIVRDQRDASRALLLLPISLVLIVCLSLANLMLSRGTARRAEYAVRRALGASRTNLVTELVFESIALALVSGAAAWFAARVFIDTTVRFMDATFGQLPIYQVHADMGTAELTLLVVLLALSVCAAGLVPAIRATASVDGRAIAAAANTRAPRWRGRRVVIASQVCLSLALLLVAALVFRSARERAASVADRSRFSAVAAVTVPLSLVDGDDAGAQAHEALLLDTARSLRGIGRVAEVSLAGGNGIAWASLSLPENSGSSDAAKFEAARIISASPDAIEVLGVPLLRGRTFDARDQAAAPPVAILSRAAALKVFGTIDAIGRSLSVEDQTRLDDPPIVVTVVGISQDFAWTGLIADAIPSIWRPLPQRPARDIGLIAQSTSDSSAAVAANLRAAIRTVDSAIPIAFAGRLDVYLGPQALIISRAAEIVSALSLIALMVTMIGLYGVLSQAVALRRIEMGVRLALGATPRQVVALVMREGTWPVAIGLVAGVGLAAIARSAAQPWFRETASAIDLPIAAAAVVPLVVAALVACYVPARRAGRTDPMRALRDQ